MQKQRIIMIIGAILALIAVFMVKVYLDKQRQMMREEERRRMAQEQENLVPVLVAKKDIPANLELNPDSLEVSMIPKQYVQPRAATSLSRISNMVTTVAIAKDEQITLDKLRQAQEVQKQQPVSQGGALASRTPIGKRAITVPMDNIGSLAGMVKPGDYVDVIAMISIPVMTPDNKQVAQTSVIPLFQNVLVLAVGRDLSPYESESRYSKGDAASSGMVTLALTPQEANILAFVQEQSKIRLVLRSPADSKTYPFQFTNWDTLIHYILPPELLKKSQGEEGMEEGSYVEIYRGLHKEKIQISK
ncbi:MAG: Flp pilus assembly protein CpaB [Candidatus Omnitrophica bacterium]|nr:Flp pilus assembly protein CpaB [Candidatus Omnitrophota bacterium]